MEEWGLFVTALPVAVLVAAATAWIYLRRRRMVDLRSLRLGRLTLLYWLGLAATANSLLTLFIIATSPRHNLIFVAILGLEAVLLALIPVVLGLVLPVAIVILSVQMWQRESRRWTNFLLPIVMLLFFLVDLLYGLTGRLPASWGWLQALALIYPILAIYLSWQFLTFFLSSWVYGRRMRRRRATEPFVVLGAGLIEGRRVGRLLGNRIQAAVAASTADTTFVMSGGKGSDEALSEAAAMRDYAVTELGLSRDRISLEDRSRTTHENLVNTAALIGKDFTFFTSDFHVFRAALFAASLGLTADGGPGGKTALYYRVPAFLREFIAVMNSQRKKYILVVASVTALLVLLAIGDAWLYHMTH